MNQVKLSIVIPCHNKLKYINHTLQSIHEQQWDNIELVLVNDGATDGTREAMERWRPRFQQRGYSCSIIDQSNQGIQAAVLNGMRHMRGELFCCIDCDDELHPAFASTLAGFLQEDTAYEWAASGYVEIVDIVDDRRALESVTYPGTPDEPGMLINYLSTRLAPYTWRYVIRVSYLDKCRITDNFMTEPRATQEPFLLMPLAAGKGKLRYFPAPLYRYNQHGRKNASQEHAQAIPGYAGNIYSLQLELLERLDIPQETREKGCALVKLAALNTQSAENGEWRTEGEIASAAEMAGRVFGLTSGEIDSLRENIRSAGYILFYHAVRTGLGAKRRHGINAAVALGRRRVIGWGALGRVAKRCIPILRGGALQPDMLWDAGAGDDESMFGIPLARPAAGDLTGEDLVLCFPNNDVAAGDILAQTSTVPGIRVIDSDDLMGYCAERCFGGIYNAWHGKGED